VISEGSNGGREQRPNRPRPRPVAALDRDDRWRTPPNPLLLEMPARNRHLPVAASFIRSAAELAGFDEQGVEGIEIAVMEAVENVRDHARTGRSDTVTLVAWQRGDDFIVEVRDHGGPWPAEVLTGEVGSEMPPVDAARGRGLAIMRALMDRVMPVQGVDDTKALRLVKRLAQVKIG
jgi:anti-sigma regulatory factor (Ser/Thr protein kinase)